MLNPKQTKLTDLPQLTIVESLSHAMGKTKKKSSLPDSKLRYFERTVDNYASASLIYPTLSSNGQWPSFYLASVLDDGVCLEYLVMAGWAFMRTRLGNGEAPEGWWGCLVGRLTV